MGQDVPDRLRGKPNPRQPGIGVEIRLAVGAACTAVLAVLTMFPVFFLALALRRLVGTRLVRTHNELGKGGPRWALVCSRIIGNACDRF